MGQKVKRKLFLHVRQYILSYEIAWLLIFFLHVRDKKKKTHLQLTQQQYYLMGFVLLNFLFSV